MGEVKTEAEAGRNYYNVAVNHIRAAAHCFAAKCFGIICKLSRRPTISGIACMTEHPSEAEFEASQWSWLGCWGSSTFRQSLARGFTR
jgi:hypothetical protein